MVRWPANPPATPNLLGSLLRPTIGLLRKHLQTIIEIFKATNRRKRRPKFWNWKLWKHSEWILIYPLLCSLRISKNIITHENSVYLPSITKHKTTTDQLRNGSICCFFCFENYNCSSYKHIMQSTKGVQSNCINEGLPQLLYPSVGWKRQCMVPSLP